MPPNERGGLAGLVMALTVLWSLLAVVDRAVAEWRCCMGAKAVNPPPPPDDCVVDLTLAQCVSSGGSCSGLAYQTAVAGSCVSTYVARDCTANFGVTSVLTRLGNWGCRQGDCTCVWTQIEGQWTTQNGISQCGGTNSSCPATGGGGRGDV